MTSTIDGELTRHVCRIASPTPSLYRFRGQRDVECCSHGKKKEEKGWRQELLRRNRIPITANDVYPSLVLRFRT